MLAKLKTECGEFSFGRKWIFQTLLSVAAAYVHLESFKVLWADASIGEFVVYSLTNKNYFLILFPFLCLAWTNGKSQEVCRYPLLVRYRTGNEFFAVRFLAKALFSMAALLAHIGALLIVGRTLASVPRNCFVTSGHPAGIIILQFLNLSCYVCVVLLLYELLSNVVGNTMLGVMLTALEVIMNHLVVGLGMTPIIMWTPWGRVAYKLSGQTVLNYRFYVIYWAFLISLLFYLADKWNGRKDYVFEETRKTG
ncbi:MAG: hypothetical protein NC251_11430 [Lachnoclostridium sp.]|nr:hypothetical protein [Lachnospira sp.]MCM1249031.1 hypothetical protein [Lachnoclostridium sp.]MCM1535899.1 hypothetical protein [Clostridium sp.]